MIKLIYNFRQSRINSETIEIKFCILLVPQRYKFDILVPDLRES